MIPAYVMPLAGSGLVFADAAWAMALPGSHSRIHDTTQWWGHRTRTGLVPGGGAHRLLGLTLRPPAGDPPGCCAADETGGGTETRGAGRSPAGWVVA